MNKVEMIKAIDAKVEEQFATIDAIKNNDKLSDATYRTQRYQRTHEIHNLLLMRTFIEGKELSGDLIKWFESAVTLTATRKAKTTIELHDGEDFFAVVERYPNKTGKDIKKAMEEQGFHFDGHVIRK